MKGFLRLLCCGPVQHCLTTLPRLHACLLTALLLAPSLLSPPRLVQDQLYNLYDAVSPGGYIIIDDYK